MKLRRVKILDNDKIEMYFIGRLKPSYLNSVWKFSEVVVLSLVEFYGIRIRF